MTVNRQSRSVGKGSIPLCSVKIASLSPACKLDEAMHLTATDWLGLCKSFSLLNTESDFSYHHRHHSYHQRTANDIRMTHNLSQSKAHEKLFERVSLHVRNSTQIQINVAGLVFKKESK